MPQQDAVAQRAIRRVCVQVIIGAVRIIGDIDVRLTVVDGIIGLIRGYGPIASRKEGRVHRGSRYARVGAAIGSRSSGVLYIPCGHLAGDDPHAEAGNAV